MAVDFLHYTIAHHISFHYPKEHVLVIFESIAMEKKMLVCDY
jgi:hypothetical protein